MSYDEPEIRSRYDSTKVKPKRSLVQRSGAPDQTRVEKPDPKANAGRRKKGIAQFGFDSVPRDNWERAFGKWTPEKFHKALAEQRRKQETASAESAGQRAPAVHGDCKGMGRRLYRGFDYGLGVRVEGRAHRREVMKRMGVEATG